MTPLFSENFLRKLEHLTLLSRRAMTGQLQGERRSPKRGQSVEFADFRPYVSGDDFRRIDWNAYARLERFFMKLFVEEEDLTVHFLIDSSQSMNWGNPNKFDYALHLTGAIGYIALSGLDRVTVTLLSGEQTPVRMAPIRGKRNALWLFKFLENHLPDKHTNQISNLVKDNNRDSGKAQAYQVASYAAKAPPGPAILISDLMGDGWQQALASLAERGFEVTLIHLLSPDELDPGFIGDFKLQDSESNMFVEITADFESLEKYKRILQEWQIEWQKFCNARTAYYLPINTALPLEEILFAHLRIKGILR